MEGDQVVLNITSNINKEDKILNADLQISYSTINGIKVEKIPLIIDKGKLTFVYKIHSEQNSFILPAEGGRFELPFTCKKTDIFEWPVYRGNLFIIKRIEI